MYPIPAEPSDPLLPLLLPLLPLPVLLPLPLLELDPFDPLPKFPLAAPDDPDAEQKIRDGVRGQRVAEAMFANDEPLIRGAANNSRQPFVVGKTEDERGGQKRQR